MHRTYRVPTLLSFLLVASLSLAPRQAAAQGDEIVANLAGGRVIIQVTKDSIVFSAIEHPLESKSVPPRVATVDRSHLGIFFGASEWQIPAQPKPIRLDRDIERAGTPDPRYQIPGGSEVDLEQIGVTFLEKLRPLVAQLHHKIELKPDEPLFAMVLIGYAPKDYGPEVWLMEYRVEQQSVSATEDYWQSKILRPRFTQLYPPEKHAPRTLVEVRFPEDLPDVPLQGLIQQNDPRIAHLRSSDQRFAKVADLIDHGQAQKANTADASDFLRAALPLIANNSPFVLGTMGESGTLQWIVPPEEPVDKEEQAKEKNRPPDAPTLRHKTEPKP
jgi:hypothetical protein